jgi:type II secretory pathway predicted ATPase ExeA
LVGVIDSTLQKSAVHDLLSGKCQQRLEAVIKPTIATKLRQFLQEKGKSEIEVEREVLEIFHEPVCSKEEEPIVTKRVELSPEAQKFFGLKRDPFDPNDPRKRSEEFTYSALDKIAAQAEDAIRYQSFRAFIGGIGSGKSTLRRRIEEMVKDSNGKLVLLWPKFYSMDKVHSRSIVSFLLRHFDQTVPQDLLARAATLEKLLAGLSERGTRVAIGFDECHRLDKQLIIALKNFWELGSGGYDRYLGIVLFGQSSFENTLLEHQEIAQRVSIIRMPGLGKQANAYLAHRLQIAGGRLEKLFEPAAVTRMLKLADTPLGLGNVANAALLRTFENSNTPRVPASCIPDVSGGPRLRAMTASK